MKEILIIVSSTLIPAIITLITVIFNLTTKYKREIILATNDVKSLKEKLSLLTIDIENLKHERDELLKENNLLRNRVSDLETKLEKLNNKKST